MSEQKTKWWQRLAGDKGAPAPETAAETAGEEPGEAAVVEAADASAAEPQAPAPEKKGWFGRLTSGLSKTSSRLTDGLSGLFTKKKLDAGTLDDLEDVLIQADLGVETAMRITDALSKGRYEKGISLDDVRRADIRLEVEGADGFRLAEQGSMRRISRDPEELAGQTLCRHHAYPDGFALFLGTMIAPTADRDAPGRGFTHKPGDIVRISSAKLGVLENKVTLCEDAPPWTFGLFDLMQNLSRRGLLS